MRIAVIGAGVAGMTTAWALAADGHEVTVFEQSPGVAEQASFMGLGLMGPASTALFELTSPQWPRLGRLGLSLQAPWLWHPAAQRWLRQSRRSRMGPQQAALQALRVALAQDAIEQVDALVHQTRLPLESQTGTLVLWRPPQGPQSTHAPTLDTDRLKAMGLTGRPLSVEATRALEPGLSEDTECGAVWHLPDERCINGRQWLLALKAHLAKNGVRFAMRQRVVRLEGGHPVRLTVRDESQTEPGALSFDQVVVASGAGAALAGLPTSGLLQLDHVSVSAPLREPLCAPNAVVIDAERRMSFVRSGSRIKASCTAPLWPDQKDTGVLRSLFLALNEWFPGAAHHQGPGACVQTWRARCAHTPDGLPLAGPSGQPGIWLNTGYGTTGWSLAPAVAVDLANRLAGRAGRHNTDALSPLRLR